MTKTFQPDIQDLLNQLEHILIQLRTVTADDTDSDSFTSCTTTASEQLRQAQKAAKKAAQQAKREEKRAKRAAVKREFYEDQRRRQLIQQCKCCQCKLQHGQH